MAKKKASKNFRNPQRVEKRNAKNAIHELHEAFFVDLSSLFQFYQKKAQRKKEKLKQKEGKTLRNNQTNTKITIALEPRRRQRQRPFDPRIFLCTHLGIRPLETSKAGEKRQQNL